MIKDVVYSVCRVHARRRISEHDRGSDLPQVNQWISNGNIRDYIRSNPDADRLRLLGNVASGPHKYGCSVLAANID